MAMTVVLLLRREVTGAPAAAAIEGAIVLAFLVALGLRWPTLRVAHPDRSATATAARTRAPVTVSHAV